MRDQLIPSKLFYGLPKSGSILVAVSGGSDSLALLYLSNAWAKQHGIELFAATVDHGLRAEAGAEAAFVSSVCAKLGVPHKTLKWKGPKPDRGLSATARYARYGLLEDHAKSLDIGLILTGHTLDDQAETVAMRLDRTELAHSARGLAGMAKKTRLQEGAILVRPLLDLTRQELRDYLTEIGQPWIDDPTNQDESYERVRVRQRLARNDIHMRRLAGYSDAVGKLRANQNAHAVVVLQKTARWEEGLAVNLCGFCSENETPQSAHVLVLQIVAGMVGGGDFLPGEGVVQKFLAGSGKRTTFGNCVVERAGNDIRLFREQRNLPTIKVKSGETAVWDGRVKIGNIGLDDITCGPCGENTVAKMESDIGQRFSRVKRATLISSPGLTTENGGEFMPMLEPDYQHHPISDLEISLVTPAIEHFCPEFDWNLVDWLTSFRKERPFTPAIA